MADPKHGIFRCNAAEEKAVNPLLSIGDYIKQSIYSKTGLTYIELMTLPMDAYNEILKAINDTAKAVSEITDELGELNG